LSGGDQLEKPQSKKPKLFFTLFGSGLPDFFDAMHQNGDNVTNGLKLYRIAIK
jgi:hypothetical protein